MWLPGSMGTDLLSAILARPLKVDSGGQPSDPRAARVPMGLVQVARAQLGMVSRSQCSEHRVSAKQIARHVAGGRWARIDRTVYYVLPGTVTDRDWPQIARQRAIVALLHSRRDVHASGYSALALLGIQGPPRYFAPEVTTAPGRRVEPSAILRVRRARGRTQPGPTHARFKLPGGTLLGPVRAIAQVAAECDRDTLVSILDSGIRLGRLESADLDAIEKLLVGRPGLRRFREARALAMKGVDSPLETRARLQCLDHGVPPDQLQHRFFDAHGRFIARCDMVWKLPGGRYLVIELDGDHHRRGGQIDTDNAQDNDLTLLGHRVFHLGWQHLRTGEIWRTVVRVLVEEGALPALASA